MNLLFLNVIFFYFSVPTTLKLHIKFNCVWGSFPNWNNKYHPYILDRFRFGLCLLHDQRLSRNHLILLDMIIVLITFGEDRGRYWMFKNTSSYRSQLWLRTHKRTSQWNLKDITKFAIANLRPILIFRLIIDPKHDRLCVCRYISLVIINIWRQVNSWETSYG